MGRTTFGKGLEQVWGATKHQGVRQILRVFSSAADNLTVRIASNRVWPFGVSPQDWETVGYAELRVVPS
jgi:uncharacterized protein YeaO (DUF488 family)